MGVESPFPQMNANICKPLCAALMKLVRFDLRVWDPPLTAERVEVGILRLWSIFMPMPNLASRGCATVSRTCDQIDVGSTPTRGFIYFCP